MIYINKKDSALDKNNIVYKILEYYYLNDLSQHEIAAKLNITKLVSGTYPEQGGMAS